jgi:hypothetical protein
MFQCVPPIISGSEWGWVLSLFLAGLTGGFMHCVLMCGPFVLAAQKNQLGRVASVLLLPYHLGRLVTYSLLGVLANFFLNAAFFASPLRDLVSAVFLGLAGLLFLAQAFPSLYKFLPFLTQIKVPLPSRWIEYASKPFLTTERGEGDSPLKFSILSNWRPFWPRNSSWIFALWISDGGASCCGCGSVFMACSPWNVWVCSRNNPLSGCCGTGGTFACDIISHPHAGFITGGICAKWMYPVRACGQVVDLMVAAVLGCVQSGSA